jgi:hypothetical protein
MARTFTTAFNNIINSDSINYFFLFKLELSQNYYFTSFNRDIVWDSQTWVSDGGVFEVDPPKTSSIVDREAYRVVITDIDNDFSDEFKQGVIGADIKVWAGLLDSTGNPLLNSGDIISVYSGFVDQPSIKIDWDTKYANLEGTSPMADLDQVNLFMVSKDGMDNVSATDTSFDFIYDDSEIHLKWGKV